jgi:signal transduction histidine kinase
VAGPQGQGFGRMAASWDPTRPPSGERVNLVNEPSAMRTTSSLADECRRLGERLRLDAVGVAAGTDGREVTWWAAPGGPPLPPRLDGVLAGTEPGWVVVPVGSQARVFARPTAATPPRAMEVLRAVAPSLAARAGEAPQAATTLDAVERDSVEAPQPDVVDERPVLWEISGVTGILVALARDTGFDTASLFGPAGTGWELVMRAGPTRPWHAVLDPSMLGPAGDGVRYTDANDVPGVGPRLAAMGCASVAVLPAEGGSRIVLDSAIPNTDPDWLDRAIPHLAMIQAVGAEPKLATAERSARELAIVERCADATRRILEDSASTSGELLRVLRQALEADELFHLVERAGDVDVISETRSGWPRRIPREIRDTLRSLPLYGPVDEATARQLGLVLGAVSPHLTAAFSRESRPQEALVAGWRRGPGLSAAAMGTVAQLASGARTVIESRQSAVDTMMTRERTRWADEIHDGLTQAVTTAVLELEAMERLIREDPRAAIDALAMSKSEIRKSLAELRTLLFDLQRDSVPDSRSDEPLTKYVNDVVKRWRLPARVTVTGDLREVPKPMLGAAYVVIREGLANAAKHAGAGTVSVAVNAVPDELRVEVADTGRGFTPGAADTGHGPGHHFGLGMMRRRVAEAGGTLDVQSAPGRGTRLVARLPVRGSAV